MTPIVTLAVSHAAPVAGLHMAHLATPFRGQPGHHLLTAYYRTVACGEGACGYVAQVDGEVVGYVCGVWAPAELRSTLLKTQWPAMALWGLVSVLMQPQFVLTLMRRLGEPSAQLAAESVQGYELRPIVVAPAARGTGLAASLVDRLLFDARSRGFRSIHLYAEADNLAAQALYRKTGFAITGAFQRQGRSYLRYERSSADT